MYYIRVLVLVLLILGYVTWITYVVGPKESFTASIIGSESLPTRSELSNSDYECPAFPVFSSTPKIKVVLSPSVVPLSPKDSVIPDVTFPQSEVYSRTLSSKTSGCQSPLCRFDVGDMYFMKKFQEDTPYVVPSTCT